MRGHVGKCLPQRRGVTGGAHRGGDAVEHRGELGHVRGRSRRASRRRGRRRCPRSRGTRPRPRYLRRGRRVGLLHEARAPGPRAPSSGSPDPDVAVAGLGPGGLDADGDQRAGPATPAARRAAPPGTRRTSATWWSEGSTASTPSGSPRLHVERGQPDRRRGVPGDRLDQHVRRRKPREHPAHRAGVHPAADHVGPPGRGEPLQPGHRLDDQRPVGGQGQELLGPRLPRQGPEAGARSAGHHHRVERHAGLAAPQAGSPEITDRRLERMRAVAPQMV